ncbi:Hexapeptide repeat of succinyl-transferase [Pricia antarctica]|uniref:Hexapeptide repeat of succinyl-transferase n=1 Tax=Pricia antarctica TaxID=641691 RepID=A0A1G7FKM6_9FLAO|nr:acyltransferase [Pricia antarctica]SDE76477.1 Hexapeptide repeat of succinyl-transferase [Pricia antarctica]
MFSLKSIISAIRSKLLTSSYKKSNISLGKGVLFTNKPLISVHEKAQLIIGDNVTINSKNIGYHLNMFMPCKLMADRPGAIIEIGANTRIHGSCIHAYTKIKIGKNCLIAANCQIFDGNGHDLSFPNVSNRINTNGDSKEISIQDNVWLGTGVIVLPGITIGRGSVISANSVVHKNVPPMVVAGGNPLRIIKSF